MLAIAAAVALSVPLTVGIVAALRSLETFPLEIFLIDALFCVVLVASSRLVLRLLPQLGELRRRGERRRVLIVGAGRSGRALARELAETPDQQVVGFLDDNAAVRRRRVIGIKVLGGLDGAEAHIRSTRPDAVLVTIPGFSAGRLDALVEACAGSGVECRFVRREIESPPALVKTSAE